MFQILISNMMLFSFSNLRFTVPGQVSNMAIIEVKMVTGWIPDEKTLKEVRFLISRSNV